MAELVYIDGGMGEGGGQVLRSSLSLSMATGKPVRIKNIRHGRKKPGLMRQHLTAVRAAATVCDAHLEGDAVGSIELEFHPGQVRSGEYEFAIGTAGSCTLVLQTILPPLLTSKGCSSIAIEGGTHNPYAPPFEFIEACYLPALSAMGPRFNANINAYGFYPAGGGRIRVSVEPAERLERLDIVNGDVSWRIIAQACVARLSQDICQRELNVLKDRFEISEDDCLVLSGLPSPSCGNYLLVKLVAQNTLPACFVGFGQKGVTAEIVASNMANEVEAFISCGAPVESHLTDQLLVPMALAGGGSLRTSKPSRHTLTNMEVIRRFLDLNIEARQESDHVWRIDIE